MPQSPPDEANGPDDDTADWHARVVRRSLRTATKRSIDRGSSLIQAAATLLERSNGDGFTVQDVADEAGQSLRTLYQYFESKDDLLLAVFEEAMRTYAGMIRKAIVDLSDPLERLGGAIVAAVRMPEFSGTGVDRGLARLRLKLSEVEPALVARSQEPVTSLVRELVADAAASGQIRAGDGGEAGGTDGAGEATYMIMSLKAAFITSRTLGNDAAVPVPSVFTLTSFCLEGLGASLEDGWLEAVSKKLRLPRRISAGGRSGAKPAGGGRAPRKASAPAAT
jgi:AcrR family transcriptional regulator